MASLEQLRFAQRFPFSGRARTILKGLNLSLSEVSDETLERAAIMVSKAFKGSEYVLTLKSSDLLEQEIAAFPVAKILVSLIDDEALYRGFSAMVAKSTFLYLEKDPDKKQLALGLLEDFEIDFGLADENGFFVSVPLVQYLGVKFKDSALKVVNQNIESGRVFLNVNLLCRFVAALVLSKVSGSLPVPTSDIPAGFKEFARQLKGSKKAYSEKIVFNAEGKISPNAFPPCIAELYQKQMAGAHLAHIARFFLASFLNAVGMPYVSIFEIFKKSPNFDEKVASYQLKRIVSQNYAPASCEKIKGYGLCKDVDCRVRHPMSYYRRELRKESSKKPAASKLRK